MTHSNTFKRKGRLETGQQLAISAGLEPSHLRCRYTTVYFHDEGNSPVCKEVDRSIARNGASVSAASLSSRTRSGLSLHCVFGSDQTITMTSSVDKAENSFKEDPMYKVYSAGRAPDVLCLMALTLLSRCWWKSSAEKLEGGREPLSALPRSCINSDVITKDIQYVLSVPYLVKTFAGKQSSWVSGH